MPVISVSLTPRPVISAGGDFTL